MFFKTVGVTEIMWFSQIGCVCSFVQIFTTQCSPPRPKMKLESSMPL